MTEYLKIEKSKVLNAAKECPDWERGLKKLFPDAWVKSFDLSALSCNTEKELFTAEQFIKAGLPERAITICEDSNCADRFGTESFTLSNDLTWTIEDNQGCPHLVPRKK